MSKTQEELRREFSEDDADTFLETHTKGVYTTKEASPTFTKHDQGKIMVSLVEPAFTLGVAETMTQGAEKYSIDNWKLCEDPRRYQDALLRHYYAHLSGETTDPESGLSHMYHVGFNAMAIDYFDRKGIK